MTACDQIVYVLDDDFHVREALFELLASVGLHAVTFGAAAEYIEFRRPDLPACLVLDVDLPDVNGLDLQKRPDGLDHPPIVFVTGKGDIPSSVRAIEAGAVDFLTKPFGRDELLEEVRGAIARDREERHGRAGLAVPEQRYASLTRRERGGP